MLYDSVGPTGNQLNAELAFCGAMEMVEIEQEVTDYLSHALELSDRPPAGMAYCRLATECITHNLHHREHGEYPALGETGDFPSLAAIISRVVVSLERQTGEVLYSINAQSRGSLHWDFETRGGGAKGHHVEAVVGQITNTFTDVFGIKLSLSGITVSDEEVERKAKETLDWELTQQGVDGDSSPDEDEVDERKLDDVLGLAEAVRDRGVDFDPWDYIRLGKAAKLRGRFSIAVGFLREALNLFLLSGDLLGQAVSKDYLGIIARQLADFENSERQHKQALIIWQEIGDRKGEAKSLNGLGNLASDCEDNEEAERLHLESLEIRRDIGDRKGEAASLNNLGNIAKECGDLDKAERLHFESLEIEQGLGNRRGVSASLNNLGMIAHKRGDYDEAERLHTESLAIDRLMGARLGEAKSLSNLSRVARGRGDYDKELLLLREAISIRNELGITRGISSMQNRIGQAAKARGDLDGAEKAHEEALAIDRSVGNRKGESQELDRLGVISSDRGDYDKAEKLHNESLVISREIGERSGEATSLGHLGNVAFERGDYDETERLYRAYVRILSEIGEPLVDWFIENGYTDPDAEWDFPPPRENSE